MNQDIVYELNRTCKWCKINKPSSEYYFRNNKPCGYVCKECRRESNRKNSMIKEKREARLIKQKAYSAENKEKQCNASRQYYESKRGRAKSMLKTAKRRSSKFNEQTDLTEDFILNLLETHDKCAVTQIAFDYSKIDGMKCNPYAPSIDRIDSNVGYLMSNVRLVIWQYNLMKGELSDKDVYCICKEVIKNADAEGFNI